MRENILREWVHVPQLPHYVQQTFLAAAVLLQMSRKEADFDLRSYCELFQAMSLRPLEVFEQRQSSKIMRRPTEPSAICETRTTSLTLTISPLKEFEPGLTRAQTLIPLDWR